MIFGPQWAACLICIPLFAVAPFASLIWALRKGAPTNLMRTGAIAGLVAGALGAAVFAFHTSRRLHSVYRAVVWRIDPTLRPRRGDTRIPVIAMVIERVTGLAAGALGSQTRA